MIKLLEAINALGQDAGLRGMIIVGNGKTGKSLESQKLCPLMTLGADGKMRSAACPKCYSVNILNLRPSAKEFLLNEEQTLQEAMMRAANMDPNGRRVSGLAVMPGDRLRAYGLTDFSPQDMPFLKAAARHYQIDIISKTLWHLPANRPLLNELALLPGINISLSFNRKFMATWDQCREFIREQGLSSTTSLNYCFDTKEEEYRVIPGCRVYHTTAKHKEKLVTFLGDAAGVCGIFDELGRRINADKKKGSCIGCNFCREGCAA
jgi:hypothetical protein